jgi:predicted DNA repair protein MutK
MAGSSLFALLDDIATVLDDVAILSKVAMKKTAGVLGDDLALNAQQVAGVRADRELPVVWAVAKGSAINKVILVPAALLISAVAPWAVLPLLMVGGLFLCFEGAEKVLHRLLHSKADDDQHHRQLVEALADPNLDLVAYEKGKIKGAIRTDFILSAEIIVISLGTVSAQSLGMQFAVLAAVAVAMTVGVYGLVAGIVKLDDVGLHLAQQADGTRRKLGEWILVFAPRFMKFLSIAGTAAMFLVGGAIVVHGIPLLHHLLEGATAAVAAGGAMAQLLVGMLVEGLVGLLAGALVVAVIAGGKRLFARGGAAG